MLAFTAFLGAFLLFLIQPMAAKALLPLFGGSASVWTVCLLFFQAALLAGYAWAHYARPVWHVGLLTLALIASLIASIPAGEALTHGPPALDVLRLLAIAVGLPYVTLAATSPLLQRWVAMGSPYRLYAVSNAASLAALLSYPVLIEPLASLLAQWYSWKALYAVFCVLCAAVLVRAKRGQMPGDGMVRKVDPLWIALPAAGTAALLATTNQMCQEIAAVPFLWIVPLALYLLTFVIVFDHPRRYTRRLVSLLVSVMVPIACGLYVVGLNVSLRWHLAAYAAALFCCLLLCHGELASRKPEPAGLTSFYLSIAAGGCLGGLLVAFAAPVVFTAYTEFPLSLGLCAALGFVAQVRVSGYRNLTPVQRSSYFGLMLASVIPLAAVQAGSDRETVAAQRNFYGILRVSDAEGKRTLTHGATMHGVQFLDAERRRTPTAYYGWNSGAGRAFEEHPHRALRSLNAGVIGLGAGTLARYGRPGDRLRFYEINPGVTALARAHFTFLADSQAAVTVIHGDARLRLEQEPPQKFDLLVVDAFSSDAIPVHLLTAECARVYRRHLAPGGWLAFHISNHSLDLEPIVLAIARTLNVEARRITSGPDPSQGVFSSTWMILDSSKPYKPGDRALLWTDQFAPVWSVLK
jgi:hypothetical protein